MSIEKDSALVPDYTFRFYLCDLIEMALILQKQVENLAITIDGIIEAAKRVPMNIQGIITIAYRKTILKEATEVIMSSLLDPKDCEAVFDLSTSKKKSGKIEKLRAINKSYNNTNSTNNTNAQTATATSTRQTNATATPAKKLANTDWLKTFADVSAKRPSLEEVKKLIEQADHINLSITDSTERQQLEKMLQSAKTSLNSQHTFFLEKLNAINKENSTFQNEMDNVPASDSLESAEQNFLQIVSRAKNLIQKRLSLSEFEEQLSVMKSSEIGFSGATVLLEKEIERTKEWQNKKDHSKASELIEHFKEMSSMVIFVPEMLTRLEQFENCKKLQLRLVYMLRLIELSTLKKDNKKGTNSKSDQMIDESEEAIDHLTPSRVLLSDAQTLRDEFEAQVFKFDDDYQNFKDKVKHCETLQEKITKQFHGKLESNQIKTLQKDIDKAVFTFPELEDVQHKVNNF